MIDAALIRNLAVDLLAGQIGQLDVEQPADWPSYLIHGPHLHALFQTVADQLDGAHLRGLIGTATLAAQAHHSCGAITEARRLARIALARLSLLPGDDLDSLRTQHNLAWFLVILRQPREAEAIYRNVLAARERMLGPDDPESLWTRHELAWLAACEGFGAKPRQPTVRSSMPATIPWAMSTPTLS